MLPGSVAYPVPPQDDPWAGAVPQVTPIQLCAHAWSCILVFRIGWLASLLVLEDFSGQRIHQLVQPVVGSCTHPFKFDLLELRGQLSLLLVA